MTQRIKHKVYDLAFIPPVYLLGNLPGSLFLARAWRAYSTPLCLPDSQGPDQEITGLSFSSAYNKTPNLKRVSKFPTSVTQSTGVAAGSHRAPLAPQRCLGSSDI